MSDENALTAPALPRIREKLEKPLPPGWQTGNMRKKERGGGGAHDENIRALSKTLASDIARQVTGGNLARE